ncbi:probable G-protein coupled receptor 139 [Heptranchias perlo]|uniref:probable G-protein coupled receptor 139 n=1 Tax=Heptranchias perlo TaxID=212740 RepID=UPI0035599C4A
MGTLDVMLEEPQHLTVSYRYKALATCKVESKDCRGIDTVLCSRDRDSRGLRCQPFAKVMDISSRLENNLGHEGEDSFVVVHVGANDTGGKKNEVLLSFPTNDVRLTGLQLSDLSLVEKIIKNCSSCSVERTELNLSSTSINLCISANVMTIVILSRGKCGLSKCVTRYLVAMAAADLLVIINDVILFRIKEYYFPNNFLFLTPVCSFQTALNHAVSDISVWLTVAFTFDRFITICCQKLRTKYCTEKTAVVVIGTLCALFCSKNIPWYFAFEPYIILENVPWGCIVKPDFYPSAAWVAFTWIHRCLTPLLPIFLILLLNSLTVGNILVASRVRRRLRGSKSDANHNDPEMENRRKSIILLFAISGNFILLWMTYVLFFLSVRITNRYYRTGFNDPMFNADQTSYMLQLLSCCTNTCIYAVTQTKFREELKNGVKYPLKLIFKLVKRGQ